MPTDLSSVVIETLEAPLPTGTVLSSVVVETLEAPLPTGTVFYSMVIENLENPIQPVAVVSNIVGTAGSPATFDGSGSTAGAYAWDWTSVPGGSAIANTGIPFSDSGSSDTFDMTNNAVLYHLNGNANDTSGNTQNGTEVGSPTYTTGQIGQAISLDGTTGQYVSVANSPAITITGNMSIAAWVNMDLTGDGFQRVVGKSTGSSGAGGYARNHGLQPDMLVVGKAVAGGLPCAVYGFTEDLARRMRAAKEAAPDGHSGIGTTLTANPLTLAALLAALQHLHTADTYAPMLARAQALEHGLMQRITDAGRPWTVTRLGARMELQFMPHTPRTAQDVREQGQPELEAFTHLFMLNRGVLLTPFHSMMLCSPATTIDDVQLLLRNFDELLSALPD